MGVNTSIRWLLLIGVAAFVPLPYWLAVVAGLIPYGAMLLILFRNIFEVSLMVFSLVHLTIYGVVLYWLSGVLTRLLARLAGRYVWFATVAVFLVLSCLGLMPFFGVAHGQIQWTSAYELYASDRLR